MDYRNLSIALIVTLVVALIGYDVLPFQSAPDHDTLSEVMRDGGPIVAYGWGFLAGHFFVQRERRLSHASALTAGAGLGLILGLVHWAFPSDWNAASSLLVGIVAGAVLWPLEKRE